MRRCLGKVGMYASWGSVLLVAGLLAGTAAVPAVLRAHGDGLARVSDYYRQAMEAYAEGDHEAYLKNLLGAQELVPTNPLIEYKLASANALLANEEEALNWLSRIARQGLAYPAESDSDFVSIMGSDRFRRLTELFEANRTPIGASEVAFRIEEEGLIADGIAYDPVDETFYVGSVAKRKIISVSRDGTTKVFSSTEDGLWSVLGMKTDPKRRVLWVCTAVIPQMEGFDDRQSGRSAVFRYDLDAKQLVKRYLLLPKGSPRVLNDVEVHRCGDAFFTDSGSSAIYRISQETDKLRLFLRDERFYSPQGMEISPDGRRLFVADYVSGIYSVDLQTKRVSLLSHPDTIALAGIDALCSWEDGLVAIQNGVSPNRVVRITLNQDMNAVTRLEVLEANDPRFDEPTLGVLVGDEFYYIANSQWGSLGGTGDTSPVKGPESTIVLRLNLRRER